MSKPTFKRLTHGYSEGDEVNNDISHEHGLGGRAPQAVGSHGVSQDWINKRVQSYTRKVDTRDNEGVKSAKKRLTSFAKGQDRRADRIDRSPTGKSRDAGKAHSAANEAKSSAVDLHFSNKEAKKDDKNMAKRESASKKSTSSTKSKEQKGSLQRGKRGGMYRLVNGKKVYAKK